MFGRYFFSVSVVLLVLIAANNAATGNHSALFSTITSLVLLGGWYAEFRLRRRANEALDDITAQLRDINQEIDRG